MHARPARGESFFLMAQRKIMENPFIPATLLLTIYAMVRMGKSLYAGDKIAFQGAQRFKMGAQVLAMAALGSGVWYKRYIVKSDQTESSKSSEY